MVVDAGAAAAQESKPNIILRPWTEQVCGIPPEQVVGSTIVTEFGLQDGVPVLMRRPEMDFLGPGKPVAINKFIGRRPIAWG
jgi:hypothetical protein